MQQVNIFRAKSLDLICNRPNFQIFVVMGMFLSKRDFFKLHNQNRIRETSTWSTATKDADMGYYLCCMKS